MNQSFYTENRKLLYRSVPEGSLLVLFAGRAPRKSSDEYYPFFTDRSFLYFTGIHQEASVFLAEVGASEVRETLYLLPHDDHAEKWTGKRLTDEEAADLSGVENIRVTDDFTGDFRKLALSGEFDYFCLDVDRLTPE